MLQLSEVGPKVPFLDTTWCGLITAIEVIEHVHNPGPF